MRETIMIAFAAVVFVVLVPILATLTISGVTGIGGQKQGIDKERIVIVTEGMETREICLEDFLVQVLAAQILPTAEKEMLKAQAVLARTAVCRALEETATLDAEKLSVAYLTCAECEKQWGSRHREEYRRKLERAVAATANQTLKYEKQYIEPLFHAVSIGQTVSAAEAYGQDIPYLQSVACPDDLQSADYLRIFWYGEEELSALVQALSDAGALPEFDLAAWQALPFAERLAVGEATENGFVKTVQIGQQTVDGELFLKTAGLDSHIFFIEAVEERYRILCMGKGHGMGLSQYTANRMAKEGKSYREILAYFYAGAELE